ncbi:MAG: hypothetical protein LBI73_06595 [Myroides sp.]|jgi:hypothetical protein|nr:hypothetical protein [Myroides sp.]
MYTTNQSTFNLKTLIISASPAYIFPTVMSFLPGYILDNSALMKASYSTIGLSSLIATIISFILLWQCERKQILVHNKVIRSILIIGLMITLGALSAYLLNMPTEYFNIMLSAFIGATIITIRQKVISY